MMKKQWTKKKTLNTLMRREKMTSMSSLSDQMTKIEVAVEAVVEYAVSYANQLAAPSEGPRRARDSVAVMSPPERRRFAARARLDAAFGSCPRSVQSWASAVR